MIATTPEDCEYYTPPELLEKVYQVMPITLDPASPPPPHRPGGKVLHQRTKRPLATLGRQRIP